MTEPDYKTLYLEERERRVQAENRIRHTTLKEFIRECHNLLSKPVEVRNASESTQGTIPPPVGKCCPTRLSFWEDCPEILQDIYNTVCKYLEPSYQEPRCLFPSIAALEELGRRLNRRKLSSEQDLESYERFAVEDHVHDVIAELCKIPEIRKRFELGDGVWFDNHSNALHEANIDSSPDQPLNPHRCRPDQFCIRRIDGTASRIVTTVEYKPPHKLSVQTLRDGLLQEGLRTMDFYETVANQDRIPIEEVAKMRYDAQQLVGAALVQEYHVMIQEGLAFSYLTNGLALVLLYFPEYNPSTLYYYLCEPNSDVHGEDDFQQPNTAMARVLCLCLLSFTVPLRDQHWCNSARERLHTWTTTYDSMHAQIIEQTPGYTSSQAARSSISYQPSEHDSSLGPESCLDLGRSPSNIAKRTRTESSPDSNPIQGGPPRKSRRINTRSQAARPTSDTVNRAKSLFLLTPYSNPDRGPARKLSTGHISYPPHTRRSTRQTTEVAYSSHHQQHIVPFCTQRCLLGLQRNRPLDGNCPNVALHQQGQNSNQHLITARRLVELLKQQLDEDLDHNCTPFGNRGAYGAPFKITCATYGYTIVGKGTTSHLWKEVSREADIYHILQKAQGSAVPVFLGAIDLAKIYFLHGAGEIQHMLFMAWGGESTSKLKQQPVLLREILRSKNEIRALGVVHQDLRPDNILWNPELKRALIIDFHRSSLDCRPSEKRLARIKNR